MSNNNYLSAVYVNSNPKGSSSGSLRVHVPSIMPLISMGNPQITPATLNSAIYNNATDCKPAVATSISTQNYATALAPYVPYINSLYYYGSSIEVMSLTADSLSLRLRSEDIDNSRSL